MYEVVVVGGGPAGSYAAYRMAVMGHKVLVLEKKRRVGEHVCCTGIIGQECVDSFAIKDAILKRVNSARLFSPSGSLLRLWREETQACILDRAAFDVAMAHRAQDAGAEYVLNSPVTDIRVEGDKVSVKVSRQAGRMNFEAGAVVIASGFGSGLSERLGMGRFADFAVGAQAEVETAGIDEVEVYFGREIAPGFFGWLVPTSPQTARVGLMSRKKPGLYLRKLLVSLKDQGKIASSEVDLGYGGIPLKSLPKTYGERVVVVGDAAGQVKPTSGGGIYYGLLCTDIAADTLHRALQEGDLSARVLSRYERRWKRRLGRELKIGYWARRLFERLSDGQIDKIFDIVKAEGIDEALLRDKELSFDWHGRAALRLFGFRAIFRILGVVRFPFKSGED